MTSLYIVLLLLGACKCMPADNGTEAASLNTETKVVQNVTEVTVPQSGAEVTVPQNVAEVTVPQNMTEPSSAQRLPENTTDTGTTLPTTTLPAIIPPVVSVDEQGTPPEDCSDYSPGENATSFRVLSGGVQFEFNCVQPLIWSQANCRCESRPVIITDPNCPHHRPIPGSPTQFQKRARGEWVETPFHCPELLIWDQEECRCEWGPEGPRLTQRQTAFQKVLASGDCSPLFNGSFNEGIKDDGEFLNSVGRSPWPNIIPEKSVPGARGGAARVKNGQMTLWFTGSNDLGRKIQMQLRFQVLNTGSPETPRTLLSNAECDSGRPSIDITFRPSDQRYEVLIRTLATTHTFSCNAINSDPYAFHFFDLVLYNNVLSLYVDDAECFTETGIETGIRPTPCYIGLGGRSFDGYIDEFVFRKSCFVKDRRPGDTLL